MNQFSTDQVRLDDESLAMLLEEVAAMVSSGRSFGLGMIDLEQASLGSIGRAAKVVRQRIEAGHPPEKAIASLSAKYESPIQRAIEIMSRTGSTEPIDETARLIREEKQQRYETRLAIINPMINVIVAAVVAFFVMPWIWVSISRAEFIKTPTSPTVTEICQAFAEDFAIAALATILVVGCFAVFLSWMFKRSSKRTNGLSSQATFCRWLAMQIDGGQIDGGQIDGGQVDGGEISRGHFTPGSAIEVAAKVVGPSFEKSWQPSLQRIVGGSKTSDSLTLPAGTPESVKECVVDLVAGSRDLASIAMDLRQLDELYRQISSDRRGWWIVFLPRVIGVVIVLTIIAVLIRSIVFPLINAVTEVVR